MTHLIIQCGSTARGDSNYNSDVDLVCLWSGSPPNFSKLKKQYGELTFYSLATINRMRTKGSLFLTHLDIDGIFIDGDEELARSYKGFRPSNKQVSKSYKSTEKAINKVQWFPDSALGELWLYDILYVALRNYVYCRNASSGIYTFGYVDALTAYGLTLDQIATMLFLREGKYRYRASTIEASKGNDRVDIELASDACLAILSKVIHVTRGGKTNWTDLSKRDYWSERLIERAIINNEHNDDKFMLKIKQHSYNKISLKADISRIIAVHTLNPIN